MTDGLFLPEEKLAPQEKRSDPVFAGRIDILYALGRHYLSLPFAVVCVPATLMAGHKPSVQPLIPLLFLFVVVIVAEQLTTAYKNRLQDSSAPQSGAQFWAARYTFFSAISGACWGVAALFWFVPNSFPAQAYLALAFLGMTATEFIARSAHRPAFAAHTVFSLGPLVSLLLLQGGLYAAMTALLVILFAAVLVSYCNWMARLLDEMATIPGLAGVLLTFDEFISGTEIFGERIQPLMQCRKHVPPPAKAAA